MSNDAVTLNAVMLRNDRDQLINQERYYVLQNSSIPNVNGRYMESGFHEGAPLYRNVREWAIGKNCYLINVPFKLANLIFSCLL